MRRKVLVLFLLLALLGGGYTVYWVVLAHRIEAGLGPWQEAQRAQGLAVEWESVALAGFPTAFRLRFRVASAQGEKPTHFTAAAPLVLAEARVWDLQHWRVSAPNGATMTLPDEATGVSAAALRGQVKLAGNGNTAIGLTGSNLAGEGLAAGLHIDAATAQLALPGRAPENHVDAGLAASVRLTQVTLPEAVEPFGKEVETLSLAATIKGALPPGKLRDALEAWRRNGGTVELTDGVLHWGALTVNANGTLALDDQLQPIGALTATIENHDAIVDAAVASGALRPRDAGLLKIVLGLMAKPGADGRKQLTLPVSLQNDRVYLGPAQIAALPRLSWP